MSWAERVRVHCWKAARLLDKNAAREWRSCVLAWLSFGVILQPSCGGTLERYLWSGDVQLCCSGAVMDKDLVKQALWVRVYTPTAEKIVGERSGSQPCVVSPSGCVFQRVSVEVVF